MGINKIMGGGDYGNLIDPRSELHIFVQEPERCSEKILNYVNFTYVRIFGPSQEYFFMIYVYKCFPSFKLIET